MFRSVGLVAGVAATVLLGGACASKHPEVTEAPEQILAMSENEGRAALEKKFAMDPRDPTAVTYGEDGTVTGGRRSQFEGKQQIAFGGDWNGKSYQKPEYEKTWWGGKRKAKQSYVNNQDGNRFRAESLMMGRSAPQAGKQSNLDGRSAATGGYQAGAARESGGKSVPRPSDARTDWLRSTAVQPKIIGYKEQQQQLEMEETKRLLGRD